MPAIAPSVRRVLSVALLAAVAGGIVAIVWMTCADRYVSTDNAFTRADSVMIASQLDGYVAEVRTRENEPVEAGDLLVRLDSQPFEARLDQGLANADARRAAFSSLDDKEALQRTTIAHRQAEVESAHAQARFALAQLRRYEQLAASHWVSPQRLETAQEANTQALLMVAQTQATLLEANRANQAIGMERVQMAAEVRASDAAAREERLNLERTAVRAPIRGLVGARSVRVGQYVKAGTPLMTVVPLQDLYVVANFKETQVARLRPGQLVTIRPDALGGAALRGRIESLAAGTGSEFALVPVENGVGNFTKIVQRVPVRIALEPGQVRPDMLRTGMSVRVEVDLKGPVDLAVLARAADQSAKRRN
jgi:membrane fusion protein (multidrug efflux system)